MSTAAQAIVAKTNVTLGELEMIFLTGEGIRKLQMLKLPNFSAAWVNCATDSKGLFACGFQ
jgi:hypothetical protein